MCVLCSVWSRPAQSFSNYATYADFLYDVADLNPSPTHNPDTDIEELPFKIAAVAELNEEYFAKLFSYWKEQVYIDGLVIYLNDLSLWQAIGRQQTTGNPLYAIAYKHPDFTGAFDTTVKRR